MRSKVYNPQVSLTCSTIYVSRYTGAYTETRDINDTLKSRLVHLVICRLLQINREFDIHSLLAFVGGTDKLKSSMAGAVTPYKNSQVVEGTVKGTDRGYPYKLWRLTDPQIALKFLKQKKVKPLPPEALSKLRNLVGDSDSN